jgi:diguanylate cyclase (GGDEF)-like protein
MKTPPVPGDEPARLAALRSLAILDTPAEERFDRITRLARRLFGVPMAAISLVDEDRQWFKSHPGLPISETPREVSFCGHAILGHQVMDVPDAAADERFRDNPLVSGDLAIRFYAGCPLKGPDGRTLGTLCVFDRSPRLFTPEDRALLRDLTEMAEHELAALRLATTDELTGLSNRRGFLALAQQAVAMCARAGQPACLSFIDLDGLKGVNDRLGHAAGDDLIRGFAEIMQRAFRNSDIVARLGGDEFVVLFTYCAEGTGALHQRLEKAVDGHNAGQPAERRIAYSVGTVTIEPTSSRSIQEWLAEADARMYQRKREKRSR